MFELGKKLINWTSTTEQTTKLKAVPSGLIDEIAKKYLGCCSGELPAGEEGYASFSEKEKLWKSFLDEQVFNSAPYYHCCNSIEATLASTLCAIGYLRPKPHESSDPAYLTLMDLRFIKFAIHLIKELAPNLQYNIHWADPIVKEALSDMKGKTEEWERKSIPKSVSCIMKNMPVIPEDQLYRVPDIFRKYATQFISSFQQTNLSGFTQSYRNCLLCFRNER